MSSFPRTWNDFMSASQNYTNAACVGRRPSELQGGGVLSDAYTHLQTQDSYCPDDSMAPDWTAPALGGGLSQNSRGVRDGKVDPRYAEVSLDQYASVFETLTRGDVHGRVQRYTDLEEGKLTRGDLKKILGIHGLSEGCSRTKKDILHALCGLKLFNPFRTSTGRTGQPPTAEVLEVPEISEVACREDLDCLGWLEGQVTGIEVVKAPVPEVVASVKMTEAHRIVSTEPPIRNDAGQGGLQMFCGSQQWNPPGVSLPWQSHANTHMARELQQVRLGDSGAVYPQSDNGHMPHECGFHVGASKSSQGGPTDAFQRETPQNAANSVPASIPAPAAPRMSSSGPREENLVPTSLPEASAFPPWTHSANHKNPSEHCESRTSAIIVADNGTAKETDPLRLKPHVKFSLPENPGQHAEGTALVVKGMTTGAERTEPIAESLTGNTVSSQHVPTQGGRHVCDSVTSSPKALQVGNSMLCNSSHVAAQSDDNTDPAGGMPHNQEVGNSILVTCEDRLVESIQADPVELLQGDPADAKTSSPPTKCVLEHQNQCQKRVREDGDHLGNIPACPLGITENNLSAPTLQMPVVKDLKHSALNKVFREDVQRLSATAVPKTGKLSHDCSGQMIAVAFFEDFKSPVQGGGYDILRAGVHIGTVVQAHSLSHDAELCNSDCKRKHAFHFVRIPCDTVGRKKVVKSQLRFCLDVKVDLHSSFRLENWSSFLQALLSGSEMSEDAWIPLESSSAKLAIQQPKKEPQGDSLTKSKMPAPKKSKLEAVPHKDGDIVWALDRGAFWPAKVVKGSKSLKAGQVQVELFGDPRIRKFIKACSVRPFSDLVEKMDPKKHSPAFRLALEEAIKAHTAEE